MKKPKSYLAMLCAFLVALPAFSQEVAITPVVEPVVKLVPNYSKNLDLFFGLMAMTVVLLVAIIMVSYSIKTLLASDYYKNRMLKKRAEEAEKETSSTTTLLSVGLIGIFLAAQNNAMALSFKIEEGDNPWIRVENSDLYLILALNFILVGVLIYLKRMFKQLVENVRLESERKIIPQKAKAFKKLNRALTDIVPIEHEDRITLDHEFDGIRELDNNLPPWWIILFFLTILFGIGYMGHYHIFKTGDLQVKEYTKEMKQAEKDVQAYLSKMAMNVDETNVTIMEDASDISAGKSIFQNNCAVCHMEKGEGNIGPNLTDEYWLHGGSVQAIFQTIKYGTEMGMPEHASKLNPIQIQQVSSFICQMTFTAGKEAEGEKFEEKE